MIGITLCGPELLKQTQHKQLSTNMLNIELLTTEMW